MLCALPLFASCSIQGSSADAPTFTLTPSGTTSQTLPPSSLIAALLPSFDLLSAQLEQTTTSTATGVSEGALVGEDLPSDAVAGWKRTWQVTDAADLSGVLELRVFAYYGGSTAKDEASSVLKLLTGESSSALALTTRTSDGRTLYSAAAPATSATSTSSVLFTVSLKLQKPSEPSFSLVKETASALAEALPSAFSLPRPE